MMKQYLYLLLIGFVLLLPSDIIKISSLIKNDENSQFFDKMKATSSIINAGIVLFRTINFNSLSHSFNVISEMALRLDSLVSVFINSFTYLSQINEHIYYLFYFKVFISSAEHSRIQ